MGFYTNPSAGGSGQAILTIASVQTASFTAAANTFYRVDATSGAITVTLPTSTTSQSIVIKKTDSSTNAVTLSGTLNGASTTLPLSRQNQAKELYADGSGGWLVMVGDLDIASLGASTTVTGLIQLAGDLGGTAAVPTTPTAVHLTGAETIAGIKTFSSSPVLPTPTNATDAANKSYIDTKISVQTPNLQTANYTLVLSDAGKVIEMNNASANSITIPTNASVAFPVGTTINLYEVGAGITVVVPTSGVTLRAPLGSALASQYATASLRQRATDEWVISGYLASAIIPFYDSFPADSTTTMGTGWINLAGVWGVTGGQAYTVTGAGSGFNYGVHETNKTDVTVQVTATTLVTGGSGFALRMVDANNGYALIFNDGSNLIQLYKVTGGNYGPFASVTMAVTSGDIFKVTMVGSNFTIYRNGTSVLTATDSTFSGTKHGLWSYGIVTAANRSWDDFSVVPAP